MPSDPNQPTPIRDFVRHWVYGRDTRVSLSDDADLIGVCPTCHGWRRRRHTRQVMRDGAWRYACSVCDGIIDRNWL